ncbi:MAG: hypothetical protein SVM79_04630 [Chloroflexota bacterium]|nr:hypothetical protein [Chloroflexota bacterium]
MLQASITLSIIALVVAFLLGLLGVFPLVGVADEVEADNSIEAFGERFEFCYTDLIDDLVSFQHDPDLQRAEARKRAFTGAAEEMIGQYQAFSEELSAMLDDLTSDSGSAVSQ